MLIHNLRISFIQYIDRNHNFRFFFLQFLIFVRKYTRIHFKHSDKKLMN